METKDDKKMKIMLDAGHYGQNYNRSPCITSIPYYESTMTWTLHLLLKQELEKYGFSVGLTRDERDKDLEVYARGLKAKGYDLFISLHSNAASNNALDGVDRPVIVYPILGSDKQKSFANELGETVRNVMNTVQKHQIMTRMYPGQPEKDYYGVIRGAVYAGCKDAYIIEHGFHTDTKCAEWLLNHDNLKTMAQAEADAIAKHYGVSKQLPTIYRVQVGAFTMKENAEAMQRKLKDAGFDGFIVKS